MSEFILFHVLNYLIHVLEFSIFIFLRNVSPNMLILGMFWFQMFVSWVSSMTQLLKNVWTVPLAPIRMRCMNSHVYHALQTTGPSKTRLSRGIAAVVS